MADIERRPEEPRQKDAGSAQPALEIPPPDVAHLWSAKGVVSEDALWKPLSGGRTNAVWRIEAPGHPASPLICKLYRPGGDTPIFANDPHAERIALEALSGTGLGPDLIAASESASGASLVYGFVEGRCLRAGDDLAQVARAFARLHASPVPQGLPDAPIGAKALRNQTILMLEDLGSDGRVLAAMDPAVPDDLPEPCPVFLHGDATAGNILVGEAGVTFIDWQCPARGDGADDLAIFLSPAMQSISANPPLSPDQESEVLSVYGNAAVAGRYRGLKPLYHWRMAAYCLWRAARGDVGYTQAADLEIAALKSARQPR